MIRFLFVLIFAISGVIFEEKMIAGENIPAATYVHALVKAGDYGEAASYYYSQRKKVEARMTTGDESATQLSVDLKIAFKNLGDFRQAAQFARRAIRLRQVRSEVTSSPEAPAKLDQGQELFEGMELYTLCVQGGDLAGSFFALDQTIGAMHVTPSPEIAPETQQAAQRVVKVFPVLMASENLGDYQTALEGWREVQEFLKNEKLPKSYGALLPIIQPMLLTQIARLEALVGQAKQANIHLKQALELSHDGNQHAGVQKGSIAEVIATSFGRSKVMQSVDILLLLGQLDEAKSLLSKERDELTKEQQDGVALNGKSLSYRFKELQLREARIAIAQGDFRQAELRWAECLESATSLNDDQRPGSIGIHQGLAWSAMLNGHVSVAREHAQLANSMFTELVENSLSFANERQRLALLQGSDSFSLFANLGMVPELALSHPCSEAWRSLSQR